MSDPSDLLFGVRPPGWIGTNAGADLEAILGWVEHAEQSGFDVVFFGERLLEAVGGPRTGHGYSVATFDLLTLLTAAAVRTSSVRLASLVAVVPFRHPVHLARAMATLDQLSSGRMILGAGGGWSAVELRAFDVAPGARGARLEESLAVIRRLWSGAAVTHRGTWDLDGVSIGPGPVQEPGPPIWLGSFEPTVGAVWDGSFTPGQRRSLERVGRLADAWVPVTYSVSGGGAVPADLLREAAHVVGEAAVRAGRGGMVQSLYAHWVAVVRTAAERRACEETLRRFFPGDWDTACRTFLIGSPEEIADRLAQHARALPRVDGILLTTIVQSREQLDLIASEVRPRIAASLA